MSGNASKEKTGLINYEELLNKPRDNPERMKFEDIILSLNNYMNSQLELTIKPCTLAWPGGTRRISYFRGEDFVKICLENHEKVEEMFKNYTVGSLNSEKKIEVFINKLLATQV